jgi:hypothetical protein
MAFQTSVTVNPAVAIEGQMADSGDTDVISRLAVISTVPGRLVAFKTGDADNQARHPDATGQVTAQALGIPVYDGMHPTNPYAIGDMVPVLKRGRIWVLPEEAVTPASPVFVRFADGTVVSHNGGFRTSADTATAVALPTCRFLTSGGPATLCVLEVNLP